MELIKITEKNGSQVVSARDLHSFLGSKKQFSDWINQRIKKYGLMQDVDYQILSPSGEKGRPTTEYALSLDAAKELAMVEGNAKGKQARQYFIEAEKELKGKPKNEDQLLLEAMNILNQRVLKTQEQLQRANDTIIQQAPKVKYANEVLTANGCVLTSVIANELGLSAVALNKKLKELKVIRKLRDTWILYDEYQNKGYASTETYTYKDSEGNTRTKIQLVWTEKGRGLIHKKLNPAFAGS